MRRVTTMIFEAVVALAAICVAAPASAQCRLLVGGDSPYKTIQQGIDALPRRGPCTVVVAAGTYHESVVISDVNAVGRSEADAIVIRGEPGVLAPPPGSPAIIIRRSRYVSIENFVLSGATTDALILEGGADANRRITIAENDVHNNGDAFGSGIVVRRGNAATWIVDNTIRQNARVGISIEASGGPAGRTFITNNTVFGNGWSGIDLARSADVALVNNLVVGNGTRSGRTGGRWGISCDDTPAVRSALVLLHNVLYSNAGDGTGRDLSAACARAVVKAVRNRTTTGKEPAIARLCVFSSCSAVQPFAALFTGSGFGPSFRLAPSSPAIGAGIQAYVDSGRDWVRTPDRSGSVDVGRRTASDAPTGVR